MLHRALQRTLTPLRPLAARPSLPYTRLAMSADAPLKRLHSASPPPPAPPAVPDAAAAAAENPLTKRVKLSVEDPVAVPPNLVETPVEASSSSAAGAAEASTSTSAVVEEPPKEEKRTGSSTKPKRKDAPSHKKMRKVRGRKIKPPKPGGAEEAAVFDIIELLGAERVKELERKQEEDGWDAYEEAIKEWGKDKAGRDMDVRVVGINDHGDGLALLTHAAESAPSRLLAIPFTLPGELVRVHIHRHEMELLLSHGDLLEIVEKSPDRALKPGEVVVELEGEKGLGEQGRKELREARERFGERVQCRYFGRCSGCQYQPLAYDHQLKLKQDVVRRAFANFSGLDPSLVPSIGSTLPSPLEYAYRTKLTPHFALPPSGNLKGGKAKGKKGEEQARREEEKQKERNGEWELTIGFEQKGRKRILDIEECPIATRVINEAMVGEREKVKANISDYKRGATLLLRDSLPPRPADQTSKPVPYTPPTEPHVCITDHHATVREQVGDIEFEQQAGSFFQNNNSILPSLLDAVKDAIGPRPSVTVDGTEQPQERFLVDAYTGSGLFAVSLADMFDKVEGVEIDKASIRWAKRNAEFNKGEGRGEVGFRDGKAEAIFKDITFPADQTTLIIDPPRKGCDDEFLNQLLRFNPASLIYISCNVRTQARDIGYVVKKSAEAAAAAGGKGGYRIETVYGADFFAQSHHVESFAVLRRDL
ncbi:hypothetical protein JCM8097_000691 [Rhodosporidiobolus ruineniae]